MTRLAARSAAGEVESLNISQTVSNNMRYLRNGYRRRARRDPGDVTGSGHWTQAAVAERLGVSKSTYADWEGGKSKSPDGLRFTIDQVVHIARVLECDVSTLLMPMRTSIEENKRLRIQPLQPPTASEPTAEPAEVSAHEYTLWLSGLGRLPGQGPGNFSRSYVNVRRPLPKTRARLADTDIDLGFVGPWDPAIESQSARQARQARGGSPLRTGFEQIRLSLQAERERRSAFMQSIPAPNRWRAVIRALGDLAEFTWPEVDTRPKVEEDDGYDAKEHLDDLLSSLDDLIASALPPRPAARPAAPAHSRPRRG